MKAAPATGELKRKVAVRSVGSTSWAPSLTAGTGATGTTGGEVGAVGAGATPRQAGHEPGGTFSCSETLKEPTKDPRHGSSGYSVWEPSTAIRYSWPPITDA